MSCRSIGLSEYWAVGIMGCRNNGLSEYWAVGPTPNSAICSAHFTEDCYEVDRIKFKELFGMSTNKRLLPNSVPSIYPKRPPEVINMINEAKNMKKKLKTSVTPQKREKVKEMPKKKMKAHSTIVKENKERIRKMRPKKIGEKGEQEALKLQIINSSTRPESGAPMKRRKETEKYNMTTSEVPPVKKMKLEQILKCGNKQEKLVNKKLESADGISTPSVVNVTVTRRILRSDISTDISIEKGNSLLATSTNLTDKTQNMRSLLPMNMMNISTDKKTQNATNLLPLNITDEKTQNARNSQPLNVTTDKKTQNLRSLLTFQISTDKSTQNSRSLLPFKITDKKSQNERSLLTPNTSTGYKKEDVSCLSHLNAECDNEKQNSKSLSPLKAGPETENQGARSLLSLNASPETENQGARSLLSLNAGQVMESQNARSLLSLNAGLVTEGQSSTSLLSLDAGQVILTESQSAGQVANSQSSRSLLSLNAGQVTKSRNARSLLSLDASPVTKGENAGSLLSLETSPVTKGQNARSLLSLETIPVTKSQNARSLLSLDASQVSNSQNPKSLSSLNAGAVTESQNARSLLSLNVGPITKSQNARSLLSLDTSPVTKSQNARSLLSLNSGLVNESQNVRSLLPLNIGTACDTKNSRSLLHNLKLKSGTVIKTQNQEIFQSSLLENKSQTGNSKNSISSIKDCQQKGSEEEPSQTVQSVLDTENVQENIFSVCINRTKGSPDVKIIQPGIGKEVNKKNRLENLLKQSKLCTHHLQTESKKENLQSTTPTSVTKPSKERKENLQSMCTTETSVTKPSKERKSQRYLRRGRRLKEKYKYKSLSEESETETDKPASLLRSQEITDYQVQDLNWLLSLFTYGINGVLAEEMGLSKTVQAIALLRYMKDYQHISGPHLFIVPLTDIDHWVEELKRWSPDSRLVVIKDTNEQQGPVKYILKGDGWDVCITSYEQCTQEPNSFKEVNWRYLVVDEVQTIIKEKTQISEIIQSIRTSNKLLLTGAQTQNDLQELLALQNFLLPGTTNNTIFRSANQLCDKELVNCLHNILQPFLLKRIKGELEKGLLPTKEIYIYVGIYTLQRDWPTRRAEDSKEKLDNNMNNDKKMEINNPVSSPFQSKLEFIQPCKAVNSSVGLKSLLKVNTSIGNRIQSRKTLQSILSPNKSTQGSSQNNLQKKGSEERSSQNVHITSDSRNIQGEIFSVCVESLKDSPNIKIIQSGGEEEKYLSFVKYYINGEFEYKGTRKLNCIPAVSDHQSVCPCIVCGDQAVGMYFGIMVCYRGSTQTSKLSKFKQSLTVKKKKEPSDTEIPLKPLSEIYNMEDNFHYLKKQNSGPISTSDILTDWQRLHKSVQEQFQKLKKE
ncbi:ISWI [Mytilus edulis]|uniref:SMARCA5 n=1 Tax=Mytilus edulis TaxID=6550 RepID=A0A8S3QY50_MYTED|nr:ISWI [Mytilus edulis]